MWDSGIIKVSDSFEYTPLLRLLDVQIFQQYTTVIANGLIRTFWNHKGEKILRDFSRVPTIAIGLHALLAKNKSC